MHFPGLIPLLVALIVVFLIFSRPGRISALVNGPSGRITLLEALGWIALVLALAFLSWVLRPA
jgi:Flp pilus assembly protein TadB